MRSSSTGRTWAAVRLAEADAPDRTAGRVFAHPVNRTSLTGVTGFPSQASASKGREWFEWMVEGLSELILRGVAEEPLLDQSYFGSCKYG
ncbi:hypothetical protein [Sulfuriferula sp. AH1]|uniref:creatininase family protein n=1 Tax=Sulfuriferula sp. AH1 TaxID=1985873 RepID=UPI001CB89D8F|nr:hypothetical protein [Sulfuriferula sp. AH1]